MITDWSDVDKIIERFGFTYVETPSQSWFAYELNDSENGYRIEAKFNHIIIYHLDESGDIFNKDTQEPFQFLLERPSDLEIILNTLIV